MNIDRRTFLSSSAGALVAAAVPPIPPCSHDWDFGPVVCRKCGRTAERIYLESRPIIPPCFVFSVAAAPS